MLGLDDSGKTTTTMHILQSMLSLQKKNYQKIN